VEAQAEALLATIGEDIPFNFWPCDVSKKYIIEIRKGLWFWWHSKLMSPASSKKTSCEFNTFIQSLPSTWSLPGTLEGGKNHNSAKTQQWPKIYIRSSLLSTAGKLFEKSILRTIQKHIEERNLLNESQCLAFEQITGQHFNVWAWQIMSPKISTICQDCCVLGYQESLWHNMAVWSTI
jgi:hypothetical protein